MSTQPQVIVQKKEKDAFQPIASLLKNSYNYFNPSENNKQTSQDMGKSIVSRVRKIIRNEAKVVEIKQLDDIETKLNSVVSKEYKDKSSYDSAIDQFVSELKTTIVIKDKPTEQAVANTIKNQSQIISDAVSSIFTGKKDSSGNLLSKNIKQITITAESGGLKVQYLIDFV